MAKTIGFLAVMWFMIVFCYIIFAASFPAIQTITANSSQMIAASTNASDFPGAKAMVDSAPVWLWFIPGLVGIIVTVATLKNPGK